MSAWEAFWIFFGRLDNVLGVATTFFSGYAAYKLKRESERRRREVLQANYFGGNKTFQEVVECNAGITTPKPVALAVSLIPDTDSIRNDVESFLKQQGWKMPIEEVKMDGLNGVEDLEKYWLSLREMRRKLGDLGATEIHLFFSGPVQAAAVLGALYRNWIPVKLYHKLRSGYGYEYWMPLP